VSVFDAANSAVSRASVASAQRERSEDPGARGNTALSKRLLGRGSRSRRQPVRNIVARALARPGHAATSSPHDGVTAPAFRRIAILVTRDNFYDFELFAGGNLIGFVGEHVDDCTAGAPLCPLH
jgi:hypothetical protein